jgi:transcriptional regulator with XRE-family HTH domain
MMMQEETSPWKQGGEWLEGLRRAQQLTAAELAEQVGAPSARWVEEVEAGRRPVPSVLYAAYARQFGWASADFAARCLGFYDPKAYEALFGLTAAAAAPIAAAVRNAA